MERRVKPARVPLKCPARTHGIHEEDRFIRERCTDRKCPDVQFARAHGLKVFHVYDTENYVPKLGTYLNWPEYEPVEDRQQER